MITQNVKVLSNNIQVCIRNIITHIHRQTFTSGSRKLMGVLDGISY